MKVRGHLQVTGKINDPLEVSDGVDPSYQTNKLVFNNSEFYLTPDSQGFPVVNLGTVTGGGGGVTDHGALTGLADDDHPQYARKAASQNTFSGIITAEAFYVASGGELSNAGLKTTTGDFTEYLDFTETTEPATPNANHIRIWAEDNNGHSVLKFKDNDAHVLQFGRDLTLIARNVTGSSIPASRAVYVSGSTGQRPQITQANAGSETTMPAIGFTTEAIDNNAFGLVQTAGLITGIDLSSFSDGDEVYVSTTDGLVTNTQPAYPNVDQPVGFVINAAVSGTLLINVNGKDRHIETLTDGTNVYTHADRLNFNDAHFYLSGDLQGDPVVNLRHETFSKSITLQSPSRRDTITWWNTEEDITVQQMNAFLRAKDSGFYPFCDFTVRFRDGIPAGGFGTELTTGGWRVGFYPGAGATANSSNPLNVSAFDNNLIPKGNYVWLETLNLGEGGGIEEELHVTLKLRK